MEIIKFMSWNAEVTAFQLAKPYMINDSDLTYISL
jgi:hypothetical protein